MTGVVKLVTASTEEPVSKNDAKLWLRIDEHEVAEDPLVESLITRARQRFEEATQRSCLVQTFDYYLDAAPGGCAIVLPKAPLVSVTSIKAFSSTDATDAGGTAMSTSGYYVDTAHEFGRVQPISAFTFPTPTRTINPVIVRFTAGYSTAVAGVPESVKTEIKQIIAKLYEHRGDEEAQVEFLESYGISELDLPTWG